VLAFFDLGNVLDELQRLDESIAAYRQAVALAPRYADAHYNLALAHERRGEERRRCATGRPTRGSTTGAPGPTTPAARFASSSSREKLGHCLAREELHSRPARAQRRWSW
jgi:tetratricopeptide (TPR) repeat protein